MAYPPLPTGRRIGFAVADDDWYSGLALFGNAANTIPTAQQFFNAYHLTPPYPATMLWQTSLYSSGPLSEPPAQEAQRFNEYLTLCDQDPNIKVYGIFFINISGYSILADMGAPGSSTGYTNTGFSAAYGNNTALATFTITSAAGLAPNKTYTLNLTDASFNIIAAITTFTTNSSGAGTVTAGIPQTTDDQANQGGYVVIAGTKVAIATGWQNDQQADFENYMQTIANHPCYVGSEFELEYFGDSAALQATFNKIVNGVGYYVLGSVNDPANGQIPVNYSTFPYFGGQLQTGTLAPSIGIQYGETGGPISPDPMPIWTQSVIENLVNNTGIAPITIISCYTDQDNTGTDPVAVPPCFQISGGDNNGQVWYVYMSSVLRQWIAESTGYVNYLQAGSSSPPPNLIPVSITVNATQV